MEKSDIKIKKMTMDDFDQIFDILEKQFDDFWTPSVLKSELTSKSREYFVLKNDGHIYGFAGVLLNENELEIMNIVVKKSERQKGYGAKLMQKILDFAKENNCKKIFLEVNEKNANAIQLYEKYGFNKIGCRKGYYNNTDDAILYEKIC